MTYESIISFMTPTPLTKRIARNLKWARHARGLTQEALARKLDFSLGYIARLELGQHDPPVSTLARLAKALRVTLAQLVG